MAEDRAHQSRPASDRFPRSHREADLGRGLRPRKLIKRGKALLVPKPLLLEEKSRGVIPPACTQVPATLRARARTPKAYPHDNGSWFRVRPRLRNDWFSRRGFPGQAVDLADDAQHLFQLLADLPHILQSGVGLVHFQQQQVNQPREHGQGLGQAVQGLPDIPNRDGGYLHCHNCPLFCLGLRQFQARNRPTTAGAAKRVQRENEGGCFWDRKPKTAFNPAAPPACAPLPAGPVGGFPPAP